MYIVVQYTGAKSGSPCAMPTAKHVDLGLAVLYSRLVEFGYAGKRIGRTQLSFCPMSKLHVQERTYPLGEKKKSHPILDQPFPHYDKINLKGQARLFL